MAGATGNSCHHLAHVLCPAVQLLQNCAVVFIAYRKLGHAVHVELHLPCELSDFVVHFGGRPKMVAGDTPALSAVLFGDGCEGAWVPVPGGETDFGVELPALTRGLISTSRWAAGNASPDQSVPGIVFIIAAPFAIVIGC